MASELGCFLFELRMYFALPHTVHLSFVIVAGTAARIMNRTQGLLLFVEALQINIEASG